MSAPTVAQFTAQDLQQAQRLVTLSEKIDRMTSPQELIETQVKVETVKAYAEAANLAESISRKASIISIQCALRVGMLGEEHLDLLRVRSHKTYVKYLLARRTYEELAEIISAEDGPISLRALYNYVRAEAYQEDERDTARRITSGGGVPARDYSFFIEHGCDPKTARDFEYRDKLLDRRTALREILARQDGTFRVSDVADDYIDAVKSIAEYVHDGKEAIVELLGAPAIHDGIAEIVRQELRNPRDSSGVQFDGYEIPDNITYYDESASEWVRIPWENATLGQLESMALYRSQQAQDVQRSADQLNHLAHLLRDHVYETDPNGEGMGQWKLSDFPTRPSGKYIAGPL